jgi:rRNA-processing protein FCF1
LFLAIPVGMVTTDFVIEEITHLADKEKLAAVTGSGGLNVLTSGLAEIESIAAIQTAHRALSTADCSVLFHARRLQAVVLTGDNRLRREAREAGLDVHGTVWAFEELVGQGLLSGKLAASKLERLLAANPRLPREECERRIDRTFSPSTSRLGDPELQPRHF